MPIRVCDGNRAAAYGVLLARPDIAALYPITPQTSLVEQIARFKAEGRLDTELIEVEGENSALSAVMAASVAGARCFTATSSWGLAFMYDALIFSAGHRSPLVMVNVNRESPSVRTVANGRSDVMSVSEAGWVQIEAETCQEILDLILISYRLAEDPEILLPVMICYDGFYLSHLSEPVSIPEQAEADAFLGPKAGGGRMKLLPGSSLNFAPTIAEWPFVEYRHKYISAMQRVNAKLAALENEYAQISGRAYTGPVETYRMEDADVVLLTAGSCAGTAKDVIDREREKGKKVGLVRVRVLQPFPGEVMRNCLQGRRVVAVVDRSINLGWGNGHLFQATKAACFGVDNPPQLINFIDGLANIDITLEHLHQAVDLAFHALGGHKVPEINWLGIDQPDSKVKSGLVAGE